MLRLLIFGSALFALQITVRCQCLHCPLDANTTPPTETTSGGDWWIIGDCQWEGEWRKSAPQSMPACQDGWGGLRSLQNAAGNAGGGPWEVTLPGTTAPVTLTFPRPDRAAAEASSDGPWIWSEARAVTVTDTSGTILGPTPMPYAPPAQVGVQCSASAAGYAFLRVKDTSTACTCHSVTSLLQFKMRVVARVVASGPTNASASGRCRMETSATGLDLSWGYLATVGSNSNGQSGSFSFAVQTGSGGGGWAFAPGQNLSSQAPADNTFDQMKTATKVVAEDTASCDSDTSVSVTSQGAGANAYAAVPIHTGGLIIEGRCRCGSGIRRSVTK